MTQKKTKGICFLIQGVKIEEEEEEEEEEGICF
jgi:hypothetical protein